MAQTMITLQRLFGFPLSDFDTYSDLNWEEIPASGQVCRSYKYHAPQGTFLDIASYFTEVEVKFFESGAYNIIFTGDAKNTSNIQPTTAVFWNALYAIFGADMEGKTQMSFEDYYPKLRSGGELYIAKTWQNYLVHFDNSKEISLQIRSQAIKPVLDKELPMESLLNFPDVPDPIPDTPQHIPDTSDTSNSGCLSVVGLFIAIAGLIAAMV